MERIKGERIERQSDGAEKHDQNRLNLGLLDVEQNETFFKHVLGRSSKLCFLCRRGGQFQKNRENSCRKLKNGTNRRRMASMMHICSGLVGPKSGNVEKAIGF